MTFAGGATRTCFNPVHLVVRLANLANLHYPFSVHIRLLPCIGMPVVENETEELLGELGGVLIHPDTGKIEGIFIHVRGFFSSAEYFCSSGDIVRFGTRICVRSADCVSHAEEFLRLQDLFADRRTVLGQQIRTRAGEVIGRCDDLQFDTDSFQMEWIFPRRYFRWGIALPASDIVEIRPDGIIVKESLIPESEIRKSEGPAVVLPELPETPAAGRVTNRYS